MTIDPIKSGFNTWQPNGANSGSVVSVALAHTFNNVVQEQPRLKDPRNIFDTSVKSDDERQELSNGGKGGPFNISSPIEDYQKEEERKRREELAWEAALSPQDQIKVLEGALKAIQGQIQENLGMLIAYRAQSKSSMENKTNLAKSMPKQQENLGQAILQKSQAALAVAKISVNSDARNSEDVQRLKDSLQRLREAEDKNDKVHEATRKLSENIKNNNQQIEDTKKDITNTVNKLESLENQNKSMERQLEDLKSDTNTKIGRAKNSEGGSGGAETIDKLTFERNLDEEVLSTELHAKLKNEIFNGSITAEALNDMGLHKAPQWLQNEILAKLEEEGVKITGQDGIRVGPKEGTPVITANLTSVAKEYEGGGEPSVLANAFDVAAPGNNESQPEELAPDQDPKIVAGLQNSGSMTGG